jgi:hypothetical protein
MKVELVVWPDAMAAMAAIAQIVRKAFWKRFVFIEVRFPIPSEKFGGCDKESWPAPVGRLVEG